MAAGQGDAHWSAEARAMLDRGQAVDAFLCLRSVAIDRVDDRHALLALYREATWRALAAIVDGGDWTHVELVGQAFREAVEQDPDFWMVGETSLVLPGLNRHHLRAINERYCRAFAGRAGGFADRPPQGRLRAGILGRDFHSQATAYLFTGVAEAMDRQRVELIAYDFGDPPDDPMRRRCIAAYDGFVSIAGLDDHAAAARIHADHIDVLIHMRDVPHGRLGICAYRPAPIQIQYLYFPGTCGAPFMDYLVADDIVVPPALEDGYTETILRMPGCYQPNDAGRAAPAALGRDAFDLPADAVVMANFNQPYKISPAMFGLWCALLRQDRRRLLWLLDGGERQCAYLRREAMLRGVDPDRLRFAPKAPVDVHLARLACADLVVDTFPYGGHTLTSDSLWSGTPVVTLAGETFASRVAASLVTAVGLPDLATNSEHAYVAVADRLLGDAGLRERLRRHLVGSRTMAGGLFDSAGYADRFCDMIESVVRRRWTGADAWTPDRRIAA